MVIVDSQIAKIINSQPIPSHSEGKDNEHTYAIVFLPRPHGLSAVHPDTYPDLLDSLFAVMPVLAWASSASFS